MDLVLRAYDQTTVTRAESLPVERLRMLLESGGLRDAVKTRPGVETPPDVYARETVVERLEALMQEGYGSQSLVRLRGGEPPDLATLRRPHWPPIDPDEAVDLHEDVVRYLTYGLWHAPEEVVAHALAMLTGQSDALYLLGGADATAGLQEVLDAVQDDAVFASRFEHAVRSALGDRADDATVRRELIALQQLLGPVSRLLRGAHDAGLRVIAYQDPPEHDGLTRFLATELGQREGFNPLDASQHGMDGAYGNGHALRN